MQAYRPGELSIVAILRIPFDKEHKVSPSGDKEKPMFPMGTGSTSNCRSSLPELDSYSTSRTFRRCEGKSKVSLPPLNVMTPTATMRPLWLLSTCGSVSSCFLSNVCSHTVLSSSALINLRLGLLPARSAESTPMSVAFQAPPFQRKLYLARP